MLGPYSRPTFQLDGAPPTVTVAQAFADRESGGGGSPDHLNGASFNSKSFHNVPARQVTNDGQQQLDIATSAAVLSKAGAIAGRHLTRQNTGVFEGAQTMKALTDVQRQQSNNAVAAGKRPRCLIDPRTSRLMPYWDILLVVLVLFTAFVTPYEVSFMPIATSAADSLFLLNRAIDVIFIADMAVNFRLVYSTSQSSDEGMNYVDDPKLIAAHYLSTWFGIDLVSILTSTVDIYAVLGDAEDGGRLGSLRALRALRALRLVKMVSLMRTSRVFKAIETRYAVDYTLLELLKCVTVILVSSHWFGCLWSLQASLVSESVLDSWLGKYGYCRDAYKVLKDFPPPPEAEQLSNSSLSATELLFAHCPDGWDCRRERPGVACMANGKLYMTSIYWAVMTITSIGYGDITASPYNTPEQFVCTSLMLLGGVLWGYVVGTFCGTIANLAPATREFRNNMGDLNSYLERNRVGHQLRGRLREYFHRTRHLQDTVSETRLLHMMSPALQSKIVLDVNERWVKAVWFLGGVEAEFVVRLTLSLNPMVLAPYELAPSGFLYILFRGVMIIGGELLTKGSTWGEDIILGSCCPGLIRHMNAKAMNYAEIYVCSWLGLEAALVDYPVSAAHIHRCAVRLAMRRHFVRAARELKRERQRGRGGSPSGTGGSPDEPKHMSAEFGKPTGGLSTQSRASTMRTMLRGATGVSAAEVTLSQQLIHLRRDSSGCISGAAANATMHAPTRATAPLAADAVAAAPAPAASYPAGAGMRAGSSEDMPGSAPAARAYSDSSGQSAAMLRRLEELTQAVSHQGQMLEHILRELPSATHGHTGRPGDGLSA